MRTLRGKLLFYILTAIFILVFCSYAYVVYLANSALTGYARQNIEASARRNSAAAEKTFTAATDLVVTLAKTVEALKSSGATDRAILRNLFLDQMKAHSYVLTLWLMFEPDGWDGRDGIDRFMPFAYRTEDGAEWDPENEPAVYDAEYAEDFYLVPKRLDRLVVMSPYSDEVDTENKVLMTSICMPVKTADGAFLGVLGIDIALESLADLNREFTLFASGYGTIISDDGLIVAHPDASLAGRPAAEVDSPEGVEAFENVVRTGTIRSLTTVSKVRGEKVYRVLVPIDIPAAGSRWVLAATVPTRELFAESNSVILAIVASAAAILLILTVLVVRIAFGITGPIRSVTDALAEISTGDFTRAVQVDSNDEIGLLGKGFNELTARLRETMIRIQESDARLADIGKSLSSEMGKTSESVSRVTGNIHDIKDKILRQSSGVRETSAGVEQVTRYIDRLGSLIEEQAAGIAESSASIEEMVANIRSVTNNIEKAGGNFTELLKAAEDGKTRLHLASERVSQIAKQSQGIQETNAVISLIASQTNLLAMNAAIEAAHAGEFGKGFTVVADEIRKLAESAAGQSKNTAKELKSIKESIDLVVESTDETVKTFDEIFGRIRDVDRLIEEVKSAMAEQSSGSRQVLEALVHINSGTTEIRTGAGEMKNAGETILSEVRGLSRITGEVDSHIDEIDAGARSITEAVRDLSELAEERSEERRVGKECRSRGSP